MKMHSHASAPRHRTRLLNLAEHRPCNKTTPVEVVSDAGQSNDSPNRESAPLETEKDSA